MKNKKIKSKNKIESTSRRKDLMIALGAIIAALIIGFVLLPAITNKQNEEVAVVVAARDIKEGETFTEDNLKTKSIRGIDKLEGSFDKKDELLGRYAGVDISAGDYVTSSKLVVSVVNSEKAAISKATEKGYQTVALKIPDASKPIAPTLRAGDLVSVMIDGKVYNSLFTTVRAVMDASDGFKQTADLPIGEDGYYDRASLEKAESELLGAVESKVSVVQVTRDVKAGEKLKASDLTTVTVYYNELLDNVITNPDELVGEQLAVDVSKGDMVSTDTILYATVPSVMRYLEVASLSSSSDADTDLEYISFYLNKEQAQLLFEYEHSSKQIQFVFVARGADRYRFVEQQALVID